MTKPGILLVDDDPRNLRILEGILAPLDYDLRMAGDGSAALARVAADPPDLLLLDVMMPGLTGFEVCRRLKQDPATQFIPIVLVTALGEREMRVTGIEAGADDFITKPVDPNELRARVNSLLRLKALHDELQQRYEELQRLERMRKTLTQMIMYDLRSPHTGMISHLHQIATYLQQALESRPAVIMLRSPRDGALWAAAQVGASDEVLGRARIAPDSPLRRLMEQERVIDLEDRTMPDAERPGLDSLHSVLLVPVMLREELCGAISLGQKLSGLPYTTEDRAFLTAVADQVAVSIDHVRLREQEVEVETAREIQQRLLPKSMPQVVGFELAGAWLPARMIGGDYFDALLLGERRIGLCIADVSGKGVPAALLMSNVQAAVKAIAAEHVAPRELCTHVNRVMYRNINVEKFITFFYGLLDTAERRLVYTNAGHNLPLLVRHDGSPHWLHGGGTVLGIFEDWAYEEHEVMLSPGDRMVMFTDGVTEVRNAVGEEFGEERLARLVTEHRMLGAYALHQRVLEAVTAFGAGDVQDDVTLLVLAVM
jgi:DNA-binding response OmpR family regulator